MCFVCSDLACEQCANEDYCVVCRQGYELQHGHCTRPTFGLKKLVSALVILMYASSLLLVWACWYCYRGNTAAQQQQIRDNGGIIDVAELNA